MGIVTNGLALTNKSDYDRGRVMRRATMRSRQRKSEQKDMGQNLQRGLRPGMAREEKGLPMTMG